MTGAARFAVEFRFHTGMSVMTPNNSLPEPFIEGTRVSYAASHIALRVKTAQMDMRANTYMRGPGEAVGTFALESAIDELAVAMDVDPIALRLRNEPEKNPTSGLPFPSRHIVEAWRQGAERFDWDRRAAPGTRREGEWLFGLGCAAVSYR